MSVETVANRTVAVDTLTDLQDDLALRSAPVRVSQYLGYLPAIYQQAALGDGGRLLMGFLLAFEELLAGGGPATPGLEETIGQVHRYFEPGPDRPDAERAPGEFLDWLAGWVALSLRADWTDEEKRRFIARVVPLYRLRGTRAGLAEILRVYTGMGVEVQDFRRPFQVGVTSTVGVDAMVGGAPPYYFRVTLMLEGIDPSTQAHRERIARAIIDQEKPAHTYYDLRIIIPSMQIGRHSTVGVDTVLGTGPSTSP
jgi:phage tail-like protein